MQEPLQSVESQLSSNTDLKKFVEEFQDHLAPKLDTYEQAIYIYVFRHSRLVGITETVIGFGSARRKMAFGIGEHGKPMPQRSCYERLRTLQSKGCIDILGTVREGTRVSLNLPSEIPGLIPPEPAAKSVSLEEMDFFEIAENRLLILRREQNRCFYCLQRLTQDNYVIEHVTSRPRGDNSYRNLVAACRQ